MFFLLVPPSTSYRTIAAEIVAELLSNTCSYVSIYIRFFFQVLYFNPIRFQCFGIRFLAKEHFLRVLECWSNASTPNLKDQGISLRLTSHPHPVRQGRPY